nr:MAG TPA: hypothetical protein [Caudoviricetes sp.]
MYVNNIEMPVTLYLSSDDQAPVLTNANLSVILKACLVTGYGAKHGAGWTMPYEDAASNTRVFAPKHAGELDSYLRVKDNGSGKADIHAYREMTGIDTGEKILGLGLPYKFAVSNPTGRWAVVASERSAIIWVESGYDSAGRNGQMLFYGDTGSAHDGSRCLLLAHSGGGYSDGSTSSLFYYETANASAKAKSYRDVDGTTGQDFLSLFGSPRETAGQYLAPVLMQRGGLLYPVPGIHTGTRAADNLTEINDDGNPYTVLHSYGWSNIRKDFARLIIRTDKWRY